jgi:phytoene synthase
MNPRSSPLQKKTSFYYPFLLLPNEKRRALESLYRFCWAADEIADSDLPLPRKKKKLREFRAKLDACFKGKTQDSLFIRLGETVRNFKLSREPLSRVLSGVERDLRPLRFKTFEDLHAYALKVAGGPGLSSMEIFGFKDMAHRSYAENLGVFLQIVNMARDYQEDRGMGRRYFPEADFKRFHLNPDDIHAKNSHWKPFMEFQLDRAWGFLAKARKSLTLRERGSLLTAEAIAAVYVKLHQKLRDKPSLILKGRVSLSRADKLLSVIGAVGRCLLWKVLEH